MTNTASDVEHWLHAHNYHAHGFEIRFVHGTRVLNLRQILTDFAETYHSELQSRVSAYKKIAEDLSNLKPTAPIIMAASDLAYFRWRNIPKKDRAQFVPKNGGRPRLYPPCTHYRSGSHRFAGKVCKCGYSR